MVSASTNHPKALSQQCGWTCHQILHQHGRERDNYCFRFVWTLASTLLLSILKLVRLTSSLVVVVPSLDVRCRASICLWQRFEGVKMGTVLLANSCLLSVVVFVVVLGATLSWRTSELAIFQRCTSFVGVLGWLGGLSVLFSAGTEWVLLGNASLTDDALRGAFGWRWQLLFTSCYTLSNQES